MTEAELQDAVIDLAQMTGWLVHHDRPARTKDGWRTPIQGDRGFPDVVLVRPPRVLYIEIKSAKGRCTPEQVRWLEALAEAGETTAVWRPDDWTSGRIEACLTKRGRG